VRPCPRSDPRRRRVAAGLTGGGGLMAAVRTDPGRVVRSPDRARVARPRSSVRLASRSAVGVPGWATRPLHSTRNSRTPSSGRCHRPSGTARTRQRPSAPQDGNRLAPRPDSANASARRTRAARSPVAARTVPRVCGMSRVVQPRWRFTASATRRRAGDTRQDVPFALRGRASVFSHCQWLTPSPSWPGPRNPRTAVR